MKKSADEIKKRRQASLAYANEVRLQLAGVKKAARIRQQTQDKKLAKQTAYIQKLVVEQELQNRGYYNIF